MLHQYILLPMGLTKIEFNCILHYFRIYSTTHEKINLLLLSRIQLLGADINQIVNHVKENAFGKMFALYQIEILLHMQLHSRYSRLNSGRACQRHFQTKFCMQHLIVSFNMLRRIT